jgi:hypothetical protein
MVRTTCTSCGGEGGEHIQEDFGAPHVWHSCYRCCETGVEEMDEDEFIDMVNEQAAEASALCRSAHTA